MKTAILVSAALVVILLLSNPGLPAHRAAVLEDVQSRFLSGEGAKIAAGMGASTLSNQLEEAVNSEVFRENYYLFSLTKTNYIGKAGAALGYSANRTVGVGLLGQVFLWSGM